MGGRFTVLQEAGLEVTCPASDMVRSEPQEGARSSFLHCPLDLAFSGLKPTVYDDRCKTPHKRLCMQVCLFIGDMG